MLRATLTVECASEILSSLSEFFRKPFEIKIDSVDNVVKTKCILHNYLRLKSTAVGTDHKIEETDEMPENQLLPLQSSKYAFIVRDKFKYYFISVQGCVPWQDEKCWERELLN